MPYHCHNQYISSLTRASTQKWRPAISYIQELPPELLNEVRSKLPETHLVSGNPSISITNTPSMPHNLTFFLPTFFCPKLLPPQLRWYRPHVHPPSSEAWLRLGDPSLKMCPRKICIASVKTADTAYKRRLVTGRPISWIYHLMISYIWMYFMDISYDTLCILWMYLGRYSMSPTQTLAASISYIWPRCLSTTTPCIPASLVICCTFCEGPSLRLALNKCLPSHFPSEVPIK